MGAPLTPAPTRRWRLAVALLAAALGGALALVLVGALRREPEPTPRTITPLTPPTTLRSLDARPELADHLARWLAAITAPDARPLAEFYAASVQFTGSEGLATVADMAHYWRDLRGVGGTFQVDWSQSRWYSARLDPGVATDAACLAAASDGSEVVLVRARAVQNEPGRAARTGRQVPCERLEGVYLLWLRGGGARWRICHETWSLEEGVCASCPAARECRRGRARR